MPNSLTFIRLLMIPAFFYLFFFQPAFPIWVLLLVAFFTDFLDGQIARWRGEITEFGVAFDPLVDRLFIFSVLISYFFQGNLALIFIIPVLLRDLLIVIGYLFLRAQRISLAVSLLGKIATFIIFSSLVMIVFPGMEKAGLYVYLLGVLVYLYSGFDYFLSALAAWKKKDINKATKFLEA